MISLVYLALSLAGLIGAGVTYRKSEYKAELLTLVAFSVAVIMLADWIAYGMLGLYDYYPGLLATDIADSALGEFLAEIIFVPSMVVTLIPRFSGLTNLIVGTAIVVSLEMLFRWLGVYSCQGWVIGSTVAGFAIYFAALDLFWHDLTHRILPRERVQVILRGALVFDMIAVLSLFLRAGQLVFTNVYLMPTYHGNQALGRFVFYALVAAPAGYWALCGRGSARWLRVLAVTAGLTIMNFCLTTFNIQHFLSPWSPAIDAMAQGTAFTLAALAEDAVMALYQREERRFA